MTKAEVEAYIASDAHAAYVTSDLFIQRAKEMYRRLETEPLTVEQSAKIIGLPLDVFRHLYGGFLAWEAVKPTLGTEH